ncbi:hypothetical protein G9A89_009176 [Geosiphon pyriformis]|nr:hypothetical protein G9A89_009176 [Geosiphon pyriformis]
MKYPKCFLIVIIFNILILAQIINAHPEWKAPGPNDKRSPCPALNSLANHGYLPRDGKNLSIFTLTSAVWQVYRLDILVAGFLSSNAVLMLGSNGKINLDDLFKHNVIEHDASLTRNDLYDGNIVPVNQTLINEFFSFNVSGKLTPESFAKAETLRTEKCFKYNPNCTATTINTQRTQLGESANFLSVFGDENLEIDLKIADPFFRYERLSELYIPKKKFITEIDLLDIQAIHLLPHSWLATNFPSFTFDKIINGVKVSGLVSSTLAELQAIALTLEYVPSFRTVDLFSDSQAVLDVYKSKFFLICPDFKNWCWIERYHIIDVIHCKNLRVNWIKVREHLGILGNKCTNALAKDATFSVWQLSHLISEKFLRAGSTAVSGNSKHFIHDVFWSVHRACWKIRSGSQVMPNSLCADINWSKFSMVWYTDSHMAAGFISVHTASLRTYFMKVLHCQLLVTVRKCLYNRCYPNVVCLFCGDIEVSDHVFCCSFDAASHAQLLDAHAFVWEACLGLSWSSSYILQLLHTCVSNVAIGLALCKGFVFNDWYHESVSVFGDSKVAMSKVVDFVREFCFVFRKDIWMIHARHQAFMDKSGLISHDGSILILISGLSTSFSTGVVRLLGIAEVFGVGFGFCTSCSFFSGIGDLVSIHIDV